MIQRLLVGYYARESVPAGGPRPATPRIVRPIDAGHMKDLVDEVSDAEADQSAEFAHLPDRWLGRFRGENIWHRPSGDLTFPWRNEEGINRTSVRFLTKLRRSHKVEVYHPDYGFFHNAEALRDADRLTPEPFLLDAPRTAQGGRTLAFIYPSRRVRHFADVVFGDWLGGSGLHMRTRCGMPLGFLVPDDFRIVDAAQYLLDSPIRRFCDKCRIGRPRRGSDLANWIEHQFPERPPTLEQIRLELLKPGDPAAACLAFSDWFEERGDAVGTAVFRLRGGAICGDDLKRLFHWEEHYYPPTG